MFPRSLVTVALLATLTVVAAQPAAATTRTVKHRIGPILMGGYQTVPRTTFHLPHPKGRTSLSYMHARVIDAKGRLVPQQDVMLHHIAFVNRGRFNGDKRQFYCETGEKERFYGTGEEDQSLLLPPGYGYRVREADRWHASWMLMNHHHTLRKVFIEYTMRYTTGWKDTPVTPHWLGVAPCPRDPIFQVPGGGKPGSDFTKSIDWTAPVNGRIVAVGTHLHGGAKSMRITEPSCQNRTIVQSDPEYGLEDDPIYHVLPQIHEPSPRFTSYPMTATGVPIQQGQTYRVSSIYDNELPHARVMGIMHAYVARAAAPPAACAPLPTDVETVHWDKPYRTEVPKVHIPLAVRGPDGHAKAVDDLPGAYYRPRGDATVILRNLEPNHVKLEIPSGTFVTWTFADPFNHDVTTANGPAALGSQPLKNGARWRVKFTRPGTYHLYCTLHPLDMQQVVQVR